MNGFDHPARQIFISYSRPDQAEVEQIARRLDGEGFKVWFDGAKLVPGDVWSDRLGEGLRESSHCLVFIGAGEVRPWQGEEVRTAINRAVTDEAGFRLIPVLLPGAAGRPGESELPPFLANRQWVEFPSLDDERAWERLKAGLLGREPGFGAGEIARGVCPYKGLEVFGLDDAPYFKGRGVVTGQILSALRERIARPGRPRFYAIIGPSGTGKSSLARAGVLVAIGNGHLDDVGKWIWPPVILKPGDEPLSELAKALAGHEATRARFQGRSIADCVSDLRETRDGEYRALADEVDAALETRLYLPVLIDQFEESLRPLSPGNSENEKVRKGRDEAETEERARTVEDYPDQQFVPFVQNLAFAARHPSGRVAVIATLRDDFYGRCGEDETLRPLVEENQKLLGPMSDRELREAVEFPARASGKAVEPALLDRIETDMRNRPGALPLLQEALRQLWDKSGTTLTAALYRKLGGIGGALANEADRTYQALLDEVGRLHEGRKRRERLIRQIFLDVVYRGGAAYSSRRRSRRELPDTDDTDHVLECLVAARLLMPSRDKQGGPCFELTHEALIEHWPRLKSWLRSEDEDDRLNAQLEGDAERWHQEREKFSNEPNEWKRLEPEYLLKGARWRKVKVWEERGADPLSKTTRNFLNRCRVYAREVRGQKWRRGLAVAMVPASILSLAIVGSLYITAWHFDATVEDARGGPIGGYRMTVNGSVLSPGIGRIRLQFLTPGKTYRIRVERDGYVASTLAVTANNVRQRFENRIQLFPVADGVVEPVMVKLEGDEFLMGSKKEEGDSEERPAHPVKIAPFAIGKYEVTFAEYEVFAKATNRNLPDDAGWGRGNRPVINVSWHDAVDYAAWLSDQTGKRYRLPTEAEWEYAARAGTQTDYWWGNQVGRNHANCDGCGSLWENKQTAPVGSFPANPFGLSDTAGNVWEWLQDCWHDSYEGASDDGSAWEPENPEDCARRVLRGGSWSFLPWALRSAYRYGYYPGYRDGDMGFRLAQDP